MLHIVWMEIPKYYISYDKNIKLLHMYFEAIGTEKEHVPNVLHKRMPFNGHI